MLTDIAYEFVRATEEMLRDDPAARNLKRETIERFRKVLKKAYSQTEQPLKTVDQTLEEMHDAGAKARINETAKEIMLARIATSGDEPFFKPHKFIEDCYNLAGELELGRKYT